ncbi:MAG: amidohydrolase family protein, partial [Acidimicrobiia bacterium]
MGVHKEHPEFLLPSEYFRRQIYASFWFETGIDRLIDMYPDNVMFESDYPHATSLSPGPATIAKTPHETINDNLADVPADVLRKLLYGTAARLYKLESMVPATRVPVNS